jgi:hypothetical protein
MAPPRRSLIVKLDFLTGLVLLGGLLAACGQSASPPAAVDPDPAAEAADVSAAAAPEDVAPAAPIPLVYYEINPN